MAVDFGADVGPRQTIKRWTRKEAGNSGMIVVLTDDIDRHTRIRISPKTNIVRDVVDHVIVSDMCLSLKKHFVEGAVAHVVMIGISYTVDHVIVSDMRLFLKKHVVNGAVAHVVMIGISYIANLIDRCIEPPKIKAMSRRDRLGVVTINCGIVMYGQIHRLHYISAQKIQSWSQNVKFYRDKEKKNVRGKQLEC